MNENSDDSKLKMIVRIRSPVVIEERSDIFENYDKFVPPGQSKTIRKTPNRSRVSRSPTRNKSLSKSPVAEKPSDTNSNTKYKYKSNTKSISKSKTKTKSYTILLYLNFKL